MKKYNYYLFDFDGTLCNSIAANEYIFVEAYKFVGTTIKKEDVLGYTREPIPNVYKRLNCPQDKWEDFVKNINALVVSKKGTELLSFYDDVYDVMMDLRMDEATLGIVTSNSGRHVENVLKKHHLHDIFFDAVVGWELAPIPKPDPSPILKALEVLKYEGDKSDVVYVGDALNDVKAAIAAGVDAILLDRNNEYPESPDYIKINSLKELL